MATGRVSMSCHSLLVTLICVLVIASASDIPEAANFELGNTASRVPELPNSVLETVAKIGSDAKGDGGSPRVAGLSAHNGEITRPNGEVRTTTVRSGILNPGGFGRVSASGVTGISTAQNGGVGTGSGGFGAAKFNANNGEARTGQGSGSSVGK